MTEDNTRPEEVAGCAYLGTAADGTDHYANASTNTAYVVWDGEVVLETEIPSVPRYVEHVRDVGEWRDLRYSNESLGEWLDAVVQSAEVA